MTIINIRNAEPKDFQRIIDLNKAEVEWTSQMNLDNLSNLHELSSYHKVAEFEDQVVGFLLAIDSEKEFKNENFSWFLKQYSSFIYIDRIIVDSKSKTLGIGRMLYLDLFHFAKYQKIPLACCEYNLQPINQASKMFHFKLGFNQVGERQYENSPKVISMQVAKI